MSARASSGAREQDGRPPAPSLLRSLPSGRGWDSLLAGLLTHTPIGVFMSDASGACLFVNARWCELSGLDAAQAIGDGWAAAVHPDDRERVAEEWASAAGQGRDSVISYRFLRPDETVVWIEGYATAFRTPDGELVGWVGSCLDVTAHRLAEQELARGQKLFGVAFEGAPIGMALVGLEGRFLRVNTALLHSLGYGESELLERSFQEVTHPDDLATDIEHVRRLVAGEIGSYRLDKRYLRKDGSTFWAALSVSLIRDEHGAPLHFVAHVTDVQDRKLAEERLRDQAERDPLTGLLNRRRFDEELERRLQRRDRSAEAATLILIDIDRFKDVNDSLGHQAGDEVLRQVARTLRRRLRDGDTLARLGGDEFAVIAHTGRGEHLAAELLSAIRAADYPVAGKCRRLTASAGVAALETESTPARLIAAADEALYRAKRNGRDRVEIAPVAPPNAG
jgi:diguanylate cyclase (GGDEF)-like protein/PAS domain S-box-containing protein